MPDLATADASSPPAPAHGAETVPAAVGESLLLRLDGFEGPLDLLLDLARRQEVDLARISALTLVDQYLDTINRLGIAATGLARAADWLVMAAWLTWLKSRLLLPKASPAAQEAERAAGVLIDRLAQMEGVRTVAAWLEARPQLGRDTYARGAPEMAGMTVIGDVAGLFEALLVGLRRAPAQSYAPRRPISWRVPDALARLRALLGVLPDGTELTQFLPADQSLSPTHGQPADDRSSADLRLQRRGALSATLVAALELARDERLDLRQGAPFGAIRVHSPPER